MALCHGNRAQMYYQKDHAFWYVDGIQIENTSSLRNGQLHLVKSIAI